ncbi:MAG: hypothetical protein HZB18_02745 [Chloroflexi bacterium]|nr:hypothetical protein [Chloroflexota bacterium]
MKTNPNLQDKLYTIFVAIAMAAGFYVGVITVDKYEMFVRGVLSGTTLILIHFLFNPPKNFLVKRSAKLPQDLKYVLVGFFLAIIGTWSVFHILDTIIYYGNMIE